MKISGVDEAGRGSILGSLVVAGVAADEKEAKALEKIKLKDSKLLSKFQRKKLGNEIKKSFDFKIIKISANELNEKMKKAKLNEIEAHAFAKVIAMLKPEIAFVDSADVNAGRFKENIIKNLKALGYKNHAKIKIVSEHKAESKHKIVAAASIIAKVARDAEITELSKKYKNYIVGSGYASDRRTISFLEKYFATHGKFPEETRLKWKTLQKIKTKKLDFYYGREQK